MALGRAFIEVHADLKPFKKDLDRKVRALLKETQATVDKAIEESVSKGTGGGKGGKSNVIRPKVKPELDTNDADRKSRGFFGRFAQYGKKAWGEVLDGFTFAIKNSDSIQTGAIVLATVIGAIISPLLAGIIGGAIAAGIGLGGIAAGVALAFQDARIQTAAKSMWKGVMDQLSDASAVFLVPLRKSLDLVFAGIERFIPHLEKGFAALAPYVDDLASGIAGFLDALGPGLEKAFGNAGPFVQIIGEYLPVIGDALGYMAEEITNSEGARAGLVIFFQMLADLIIWTTDLITFLADGLERFLRVMVPFLTAAKALGIAGSEMIPDTLILDMEEAINAMDRGKVGAEGFAGGLDRVGGSAANGRRQVTDLTTSLNTFFQNSLNWTDAAINYESALDGVASSLKENGKNFDINTAKGRENVKAVNDTIKAAIAARDAKIKETGSVAEGNNVYSTYISRLVGVLRKAGLTESQINDLVGAYRDIPPEVSTEVNAPGLSSTLAQAQRLASELRSLNTERRAASQSKKNPNGQGTGGLAEGGVVRREQLTWIGEGNKPEAVIPLTNPRRAAEVMNEAGLTGLGGTIVVQLVMDGKVIEEKVVQVNQAQARKLTQQPRKVI